jgi:probable HAF family extracellular repeat protein
VSDRGQVVGSSSTPGNAADHAFSWTERGGIVDLGTLGGSGSSYAWAVSDGGQVVGDSLTGNVDRAFSWTREGGIVDLGNVGGTMSQALAVNERGMVAGYSFTARNAEVHAVLWRTSGP